MSDKVRCKHSPEPATERAGDDEPPFYGVYPGIVGLHIPTLRGLAREYENEFAELGVPFAWMVDAIEKGREERDYLRAELAELKRLGVAAGLARIASEEAGE